MRKRIISFITALSMTLMIFTSMPTAATLAITTMDVTSFTASADTANGTHTFTNPDTFFYTDEENKFDYKEYCLTQAQIGKAINHPGAFVNSVASITVNYEASDDISGIIIAHSSDEANGWWAEESVSISQGSNSVTTAKPIKVDNGAVEFQIKTVNSDTNLINKTLKINSVTLTGVGYVSEKIDAANFTYSIFNNTSMEIGDSFTVSYNAANTPPAAKYSFKYKVPKSDGSGYDYYTPVLNNKVNGTDGQEATGLKVTSSTAGDITTYTFTAIAASAAEFELNIEVSASGTWSDTAFGGSSAYKVVDSTPAPTLTFDPETANVNVGRTTTVTIIGKNTDGYEYTAKSHNDAIATATANGTVVTVTGVTIGLVKIKVTGKKSGADDITAEFNVNVPHDLEKHDAVSATCTTDGNEAYWTCSVKGCKKIFSNEDGTAEFDEIPIIPKLGHNYVNGECTRCHSADPSTVTPTLTISPTTLTLAKDKTAVITETVTNGYSYMYNETTSDANIVAITENSALKNGVRTVTVRGVSEGTATITLKITNPDGEEIAAATCEVTVTAAECEHTTGITYVKDEDDPSSGHWKICSVCGKVGKEPEEHSMDADRSTARPATCTEDGKYYDMVCAECGYRESGAVIPAKGHSFTNYISNNDATCTADGTKTATCDRCGETETIADVGSALGHSFTNYVSNNDATCTADGTKTAKCDRCDETETIEDVGSALGHSCVEHAAVPAACTADGNEAYWTCSGCDKMFADEDGTDEITAIPTIPALGHSYVNGVCERCGEHENIPSPSYTVTPATATIKIGLSNGQVFTLEGYTAIEQIDWDIDPDYAAKYVGSQFGLEHNQCKIVGTAAGGPVTLTAKSLGGDVLGTAIITFTDGTVPDHTHTPAEAWTSDATGHWHACSGCTEKVDFAAHTFDGGEETLPPTADNEGIMTYTCEICQYKETRSIPKLDPSPDTSGDKPEPPVTTSYVGGFSSPSTTVTSDAPQTAEPPVSSPEEITDAPSTSPETAVQPPLSETTALPEQSGESSSAPDVINVGNISKDEISGENAPRAGLSDTAAELAEKVLGSKDIELINGGANMTIMLSVSDISDYISKEDKNSIEAALDTLPDYILGQYLDISLIKTVNGEQEIITEAKAPLTVTIDIPEAIRGADREYKIIRVHGGETVIMDDIDSNPDTVTVKTDRFSSYAIVYRDKETKPGGTENNQNTGVESNTVFFAAAGITALSLLVLLHFTTGRNGISEAKKERLFRKLIAWGKKGGKLRSLTALALIWILLAFYYSIGMKTPQ